MDTYARIHTTSGSGDDRTDTITWCSKEKARDFLGQWNQAVYLYDKGKLFSEESKYHQGDYRYKRQQWYARICCTWLIPNGMVEPHCVAQGE